MFPLRKRIFAGKQSLRTEPFCPYLSNENGYLSLRKQPLFAYRRPSGACQPRPSVRDGRLHH